MVAARKHDVVPIRIEDRLERALPAVGLALLEDPETGAVVRVDLSDPRVRRRLDARPGRGRRRGSPGSSTGSSSTTSQVRADAADYVKPLLAFFQARARRLG